jgi:hypothetical protein
VQLPSVDWQSAAPESGGWKSTNSPFAAFSSPKGCTPHKALRPSGARNGFRHKRRRSARRANEGRDLTTTGVRSDADERKPRELM